MIFYRYVLEQWDSTKNIQKKHITEIAGPVSFILMKKGFLKVKFILLIFTVYNQIIQIKRWYYNTNGYKIKMTSMEQRDP